MTEPKKNSRRTVLKLAAKYQVNQKHAKFVEKTSLKLFDLLAEYHHLGNNERILLSHASLLHDIGSFINEKKHHRHTKYIIDSDDLLKAYPEEQKLILSLVTYNHRKRIHKDTMLLQKKDRDIAIKLSSILRLADSLDNLSEKVVIKNILVQEHEVKISVGGILPERLANKLLMKKDLFCEVFNFNVSLSL